MIYFTFSLWFAKWYWRDVNTISQFLNQNYEDSLFQMQENKSFFDIYKLMYTKQTADFVKSYKEVIGEIVNYFQSRSSEQCKNIGYEDIFNIFSADVLSKTKVMEVVLKTNNNLTKKEKLIKNDQLLKSCLKIYNCISNTNISGDYMNTSMFSSCINEVSKLFVLFQSYNLLDKAMKDTNFGDDLLVNGTLDDGPYDLLIDVYDINKLLFEGKKVEFPGIVKFYPKMPNIAKLLWIEWEWSSSNNNSSYVNITGSTITTSWSTTLNTGSNSLSGSANITNLSINLPSNAIVSLYSVASNLEFNASTLSNSSSVFSIKNNNDCIWPLSYTSSTNNYNNTSINITNLQIISWWTAVPYSNLNMDTWYNVFDVFWMIPIEANEIDISSFGMFEDIINDWEPGYMKLANWGKWICFFPEDWSDQMVDFTICFVPPEKRPIVWSKKVYSIEDIISEIKNVIFDLKQSWALIKHKMTDEFWEISLQDIKFSRIFIFDFVVQVKPLFQSFKWYLETQAEKDEIEYEDISFSYWLKYADTLQDPKERNKYVYAYNIEFDKASNAPAQTLEQKNTFLKSYLAWSNNIYTNVSFKNKVWQKQLYVNVKDIFNKWLDWNIKMWKEIYIITTSFADSAYKLYGRILSTTAE